MVLGGYYPPRLDTRGVTLWHEFNMGQNPTSSSKRYTVDESERIRRDPPAIMDVVTVACYLSQSERKTREDIRLRRIPHIRLGGKILVKLVDLHSALDSLRIEAL